MPNRRSKHTWLAIIAGILAVVKVPGSAAASECLPSNQPTADQVFIDSNTAKTTGATYFPRGSRIEVVFTGKNPFKYSYALSVDTVPIDSSGVLAAFFGLVPVLGPVSGLLSDHDDQANAATIAAAPLPGAPAPAVPGPVCAGVEKQILDRFGRDLSALIQEGAGLRGDVAGVAAEFASAQQSHSVFLAAVQPDAIDCQQISTLAANTRATLASFRVGSVPTRVAQHQKSIEGLTEVVRYFGPSPACQARHAGLLLIAEGLRRQAEGLATTAAQAVEGKRSFAALVQTIDSVAASPNAYFEIRPVSAGWKPAIVTPAIVRTPRSPANAPAEAAKTVEIQIGQPFFTLAVGLGGSDIAETVISREASLLTDASGMEVLGERFAVTETSDPTALGAAVLHANIWRPWQQKDRTVALSLGLTFSSADQASDFGFLFGPSLGLLENSLYITAGYHLRDTKTLGGGFAAGDSVPEGLEEIPLRKNAQEGLVLVVSYRIQ